MSALRASSVALLLAVSLTGCTPDTTTYVPRSTGTLTFCRDIAPIVFAKCAVCHRPGEAAPFSLLSYDDVRDRARQIAAATSSRYMPPWLPVRGHGEFSGDRSLTIDEIGMIAQWVKEGAEEGDPADLPSQPTWTDGWALGKPDLTLTLPGAFQVPAGGPDVYRNFVFPDVVPEGTYVRALEIRPENRRVVHHALLFVDRSPTSRALDAQSSGLGFGGADDMKLPQSTAPLDGFFNSWNPGKRPFAGYGDMAWRLEPGDDLVLQMHLQPSGKVEPVTPSIGIYLAKEPPKRFPFLLCLRSILIDIPAGAKDSSFEVSYVVPIDLDVLGVLPHAHYVCKQMQGYATLPDGTRRWLLHIDDWDFNWQGDYRFASPVFLPKGTRITQRYTYDNSAENPRNPRVPPVRVQYGPNSTDEMGELWIQVVPRKPHERPLLVDHFERWRLENENVRKALSVLAKNPDDWEMLVDLAKCRFQQGRKAEAIEHLERASRAAPREAEPHRTLAYVKLRDDTPESLLAAARHLEAALRLRPDYFEAFNDLGSIWLKANDLAKAAQCFQRAHQIEPNDAVSVYNLGVVASRSGDVQTALRLVEEALRLDPGYTPAREAREALTGRRR